MDFQTLLKLRALVPDALLQSLNHVVEQERDMEKPDLPIITVYISGGIALTGHLIHYDQSKQVVLLASSSDGRPGLRYLWSSSILGVDIIDAGNLLVELSDGEIPFVPAPEDVPTKMEIKSALNQGGLELTAILGAETDLIMDVAGSSETERFYAPSIIQRTVSALTRIAENPLGREALAERIRTVHMNLGPENKIHVLDRTLTIDFNINKGLKACFTIKNLQDQIEQHL